MSLRACAGNVLVIAPPGTAKGEAVRRIARDLDASDFESLLGRFTEPSEMFGPVDLRKLREGKASRDGTRDRAPGRVRGRC